MTLQCIFFVKAYVPITGLSIGWVLTIKSLTLCHLSVLGALNPFAVVKPDDGGVRQTRHFTFQHRLLRLDHIQVVKRFDEVRHGEALHLILWDLGLLRDRWHLLQFSPKGKRGWNIPVCLLRHKITFIDKSIEYTKAMAQYPKNNSYICEEIAGRGSCM